MVSASCVVCWLLILLSLLLLVLAQGREWQKHILVLRSQKEKAGSVLSGVSCALFPSCSFDHENAHLHPRNHDSVGHFGNTGSGGFDSFVQIQNPASHPQCLQTVAMECHWHQSWKGLQQAASPPCLSPGRTRRTVLFGPEQTRRFLSYKPRNEKEGLEKQASYLVTTKLQEGKGSLSLSGLMVMVDFSRAITLTFGSVSSLTQRAPDNGKPISSQIEKSFPFFCHHTSSEMADLCLRAWIFLKQQHVVRVVFLTQLCGSHQKISQGAERRPPLSLRSKLK